MNLEGEWIQSIRDVSGEDTALNESIASSGFTPLEGSQPKIVLTVSTTRGIRDIRVIPPTRITSHPPSDCKTTVYYRSLEGARGRWQESS